MGCASAKRLPCEPDDYVDQFEAPVSTKSTISTSGGGDSNLSTSTCASSDDAACGAVPSDGLPGAPSRAQSSRHSSRKATGDALLGRPTEGTADPRMMKKRNKRGDWRQARKPFLSDLPEVDADIPYRVNLVMLGMAADQVAQSACQSAAARSLVARPPQEKEETRAAGGDFLAEVFSAASETAAGEERAVDERRVLDADNDRCLCKVSGGPFACVNLAKLAFTRVAPGAELPVCGSPFEALSTIIVITLVVAGSVLGEDPAAAVHDQLRALKELVGLLRVRTPTKLRPVRAVLLCYLDEARSLSENNGARTCEWQDIISEFEEENGKLWKFGPVDPSDKEEVHATFEQMASARVSSPTPACEGGPEDSEALALPGELMTPSISVSEASQSRSQQAARLHGERLTTPCPSVSEASQTLTPFASVSADARCVAPSRLDQAVGLPIDVMTPSVSVSEASQSRQAARLHGERLTTPCPSMSEASQALTPSVSVSDASFMMPSFSVSEVSQSRQAARLLGERLTTPCSSVPEAARSLPVSEASQSRRMLSSGCFGSESEASQTQQRAEELLPVMANISPSLPSSKASTPMMAAEPAVPSEEDEAFLEQSADDAAQLASFIDKANAAMDTLSAVREGDELNNDNPSSLTRTHTID
ncbi:unnamed protein product [Prorocentrum cordatum]|uniref:Uncharacterized protein n=1 Tax=Prorocentrum cordatum TaxID=2364126 RepID=A0ABN9SHE6_9DINO|nr:unnamed protein product [Polarella glacialis]